MPLPPGFVLDKPKLGPSLPQGFSLDTQNLFADRQQPAAVAGLQARSDRPKLSLPAPFNKETLQAQKTISKELLPGVPELALTFATGIAGSIAGGVSGIVRSAANFISGGDDPLKKGAETSEKVREAITIEPFTQPGRNLAELASLPLGVGPRRAKQAGEAALGVTGSPGLATLVQTGLETAPMALGARAPGSRTISRRNVDVGQVLKETEAIGLDVGAPIVTQRSQTVASGQKQAGGQTQRAQDVGVIQQSLQDARVRTDQLVDDIYTSARGRDASVNTFQVTELQGVIEGTLQNRLIAPETTPKTIASLNRLDEIASGAFETPVSIRKLMEFRIANNAVRGSNAADNAALSIINGQVSAYLRAQVSKDLVSGDAAAIAKWEQAFEGTKQFKELFDANKVIKDLSTRLEATPETAKKWIMGANAIGAKTEAATVVNRIAEIVPNGKNGVEFGILRQEVLFDIVEPLLKDRPNFKGFADNYDKFVRNNKSLSDALFPESASEMLTLRRFASALEKGSARGLDLNLNQTISRILFGHEIAKGAVRVNLGTNLMNIVRGTVGSSPKQLLISDFTGYDITAPLLPKTPIVIGGLTQEDQ